VSDTRLAHFLSGIQGSQPLWTQGEGFFISTWEGYSVHEVIETVCEATGLTMDRILGAVVHASCGPLILEIYLLISSLINRLDRSFHGVGPNRSETIPLSGIKNLRSLPWRFSTFSTTAISYPFVLAWFQLFPEILGAKLHFQAHTDR